MNDSLDNSMDQALAARVDALHARDDESGDGQVNAADMKLQLDRIEAQLELQDQQNRALLRGQRIRFWMTLILALLLCGVVIFLWVRVNGAYAEILQTTGDVNALAGRLQQSLDTLDNEELEAILHKLPEVADKISGIDTDALNEVLTRVPALVDAVTDLQERVQSIQDWFGGLFGGGR